MGFFQDTVVHKYLKANDANLISQAYAKFGEHFLNPRIQENIRNSKEEQYQGEFLIDLFVKVLGYTKNPNDNFNLTTEYKNIKDSKKADGAILVNGTVKAVIELKGTNTTDLGKVEEQAFGYKNNQPECIYVITSNFEKLRLYIDNAIEHIEFNLFTLNFKEFELLYLCLAFENIEKNIPKKIKDESLSEEDVITKKLYKDYSIFKSELFNNIVTLNPGINPIDLFQKTQKLIDRFLFLFFAEDRSLLPPNSVRLILSDWRDLQDRDEDIGLYDRFKKYFEYLNTGYKGKRYEVFAYNGGLFKLDEILDVIKIDSDLLYKHTLKLSEYNFNSEVDVNILGHIFENSLNELDELKAQSEGEAIDRKKTRRKKDGVFYTPKYITKYIVDNTVGKLCLEKKQEIDIRDEDYIYDKKRPKKTTLGLIDKLSLYKEWLLQLTICDPACGSGAFLNQALDFLIKEHKYLDELQAKLLGETLVFNNIEKSILENNLYGVDINEESVEIAKLSLWLRTAQPNRKLNDLNNNIKCGNSLIDDPEVAGEKAFNWQNEFPDIFSKGGFDVVIGNPPYVLCQPSNTNEITLTYYKNFTVSSYKIDLFHLFFEKSIQYIKQNGKLGFITPNTYLTNKHIQKLRHYILKTTKIETIINYEDNVFVDAGVDVATIILKKEKSTSNLIETYTSKFGRLEFLGFKPQIDWINEKENTFNIKQSVKYNLINCVQLGDICSITFGLQTKDKTTYVSNIKRGEDWEKCYTGKDINRYYLKESSLYFKNDPILVKAGGSWDMHIHKSKKILVRQVGAPEPIFAYDNYGLCTLNTMYSIVLNNEQYNYKYLLAILNSKYIKYFWMANFDDNKELFPKIKGYQLKQLPIKITTIENQTPYIERAEIMLYLNTELTKIISIFLNTLKRKFQIEILNKRLHEFYLFSYKEFINELIKRKIKLTLSEEAEWEEYFNMERKKVLDLLAEIESTDKEIDQMVYKLYELTEEEIRIIESE